MAKNRGIGFGIEDLPRIVGGEGSYLIDDAGRRSSDGKRGYRGCRTGVRY
jgi:hypothetical protein